MVTVTRLLGHADAMDDAASPSVITVFRSRLRPDAAANGYAELAARMESRARAMAGFIDFKTFIATDGERVSIITFDTWDHHRAWRDDPEHRAAAGEAHSGIIVDDLDAFVECLATQAGIGSLSLRRLNLLGPLVVPPWAP
jgi:heme-degrading monooxygenase HmoA